MRATVLLVEDHPTMREAVRLVLASEAYEVADVADGAAALAAISAQPPDVVVLDLHMPVMDGAEVLRALRADPVTASLPVIVITADGEEGRSAAVRLGADGYVTKPFDPTALLLMVGQVLASAAPQAT